MKKSLVALLVVSALGFGFVSPAFAGKTYTPSQLRKMVKMEKYPRQGSVSKQSQSVDYSSCVTKVFSVVGSIGSNYPTRTIASTNNLLIEKVWTNDAAMTFTCSAEDEKLIITSAPYL